MTWPAPTTRPPAIVVRPRRLNRQQRIVIACLAVAAVVGVVVVATRDSEPAEPTMLEEIKAVCPRAATCGINYSTSSGVYRFEVLPDVNDDGVLALGIWAVRTGCVDEVDFERIQQTRALDGMVESGNGRSTWTYHPDAGLVIVCEP